MIKSVWVVKQYQYVWFVGYEGCPKSEHSSETKKEFSSFTNAYNEYKKEQSGDYYYAGSFQRTSLFHRFVFVPDKTGRRARSPLPCSRQLTNGEKDVDVEADEYCFNDDDVKF